MDISLEGARRDWFDWRIDHWFNRRSNREADRPRKRARRLSDDDGDRNRRVVPGVLYWKAARMDLRASWQSAAGRIHTFLDRCGHPPGHLSLTQTSQSLRVPPLGSSKRRLQPLPHYPRSKEIQCGSRFVKHAASVYNRDGSTNLDVGKEDLRQLAGHANASMRGRITG
jgi:hypothetical protein